MMLITVQRISWWWWQHFCQFMKRVFYLWSVWEWEVC